MSKLTWGLLILITLIAFFLRFYKVTEDPPSLNWDEVSIGYNAYSILKTGKDEWNQPFPIHFKAYGEYKLPVQIYFTIPGIYLFGLNEMGVRILPVVYGTLTVLLLFFLTRKIFDNNWVGLFSAFLLAVSPWHLQLTRASFESSFSVFWVILGIWFLIKGFTEKKWLVLSMIPFAISVYTYNSARVFTPLFLIVVLFLYRQFFLRNIKYVIWSLIVFLVLMLSLVPFFISPDRNSRYKLVSVTDDPGLIPRIEENRNLSNLPQPLPRVIHNRVTYIGYYLAEHYLAHFSPDFLFINGAPHKQHHVQNIGELYLFQAPLFILGLLYLFRLRGQWRGLLLTWWLLAFVPVSVTNDSIPHALRTIIAAPVLIIISAQGGYYLYEWYLKKRYFQPLVIWVLSLGVITISVIIYLQNYYLIYPYKYSYDWQYGNKQVVEYIQKNQNRYDAIYFTRYYGEPQTFTLFYLNYDPIKYQTDPSLVRFETHDWVRVLHFDKYNFPDLGDKGTRFEDIVKQNPGKKILFIGKLGDFEKGYKSLEKINFLDGKGAFEIVENI